MKSEIPPPVACPSTEPDKERKYYRNAYINYYVRLFDQEQFKGKRATEVARYAGKTWSAMHEDEKKTYREMALKAPQRRTKLGKRSKKKSLQMKLSSMKSDKNRGVDSEEMNASVAASETYVTASEECKLPIKPGSQIDADAYTEENNNTAENVSETQTNENSETHASMEPTCDYEDTTETTQPGRRSFYRLVYSSSSSSGGTPSPSASEETLSITEDTSETQTTQETSHIQETTVDTSQTEDISQVTEETCPTETAESATSEYTDQTCEVTIKPKKSTRVRSIFSPTSSIQDSPSILVCTRTVCATPQRRKRSPEAAVTPRAPKRRKLSPSERDKLRGQGSVQSTPRRAKVAAIYSMSTQKDSNSKSKFSCGREPHRLEKRKSVKRKLIFVSDSEREESLQPKTKRTKRNLAS